MKPMRPYLDSDRNVATFRHQEEVTQIPLLTEGAHTTQLVADAFTSDEGSSEENDGTEDADIVSSNEEDTHPHGLVLTIKEKRTNRPGASKEEMISNVFSHVTEGKAEFIQDELFGGGSIVVWQLSDLCPASVPYKHSFDLND